MRYPQLIVWEVDGRLAALLRPLAEGNRWTFREARQAAECLRLLAPGGPAVVVLRVGRDLAEEFGLLERMSGRHPGAAAVVVADAGHGRLAALAWDLGAAYVHLPPTPREALAEVVAGLMNVAFLEEAE
jgi:DNA-binding NtrC family response regulator